VWLGCISLSRSTLLAIDLLADSLCKRLLILFLDYCKSLNVFDFISVILITLLQCLTLLHVFLWSHVTRGCSSEWLFIKDTKYKTWFYTLDLTSLACFSSANDVMVNCFNQWLQWNSILNKSLFLCLMFVLLKLSFPRSDQNVISHWNTNTFWSRPQKRITNIIN